MRVLLVDELFPPVRFGGAEISTQDIAAQIGRKHEVVVFTPCYHLNPGLEESGTFRIFRYQNMFTPIGSIVQQKLLFFAEMTKQLASFARVFRPDILHGQNAMSIPAIARISEMSKTIGIAHVRDHRFECFTSNVACASHHDATLFEFARCVGNPIHALIYPYAKLVTSTVRTALIKCGKVIAVSHYLKTELLRTLSADINVSYDGVDLDRIQSIQPAKDTAELALEPDKIIFYAGGFHEVKGIFQLLNGFMVASKKMRDLSLLIAGDGPRRYEVENLVENSKMKERVKLLGQLSNEKVISFMKSSGLVVVPSLLPEAGSRVIIEAMACGKPVLASNRGANPELIGDAGVTVSPSASNIANAIVNLTARPEILIEMSALARQRSTIFSLNTTVQQILHAYDLWSSR